DGSGSRCSNSTPRRWPSGTPPTPTTNDPNAVASGDVEVALRDFAQQDVVGRIARLAREQPLEAFPDLLARHLDAVALQDLPDQVVVCLDGLGHREVAVRAGAATGPEVERGHVEEHLIRLGGLDQDDVALEVRVVLVLAYAELEAGVQQGAEHLVEH